MRDSLLSAGNKHQFAFSGCYANLGVALSRIGKVKEAMDAWQKALEIDPDQIYVANNLAWSLAVTTDAALRDGAKAVALAQQANQLSGGNDPAGFYTRWPWLMRRKEIIPWHPARRGAHWNWRLNKKTANWPRRYKRKFNSTNQRVPATNSPQ